MSQDPVQNALDVWKKALEDGTQAWVRSLGQMQGAQASTGAPDFSQFWRPILGQGMDMWQKAAAQGGDDTFKRALDATQFAAHPVAQGHHIAVGAIQDGTNRLGPQVAHGCIEGEAHMLAQRRQQFII